MHLRPPHHPGCDGDCDEDCPRGRFHAWLDAPLTTDDLRKQQDRRARSEALMRGELPT